MKISTYGELRTLWQDYLASKYDLVMIESPPGMGKTWMTTGKITINGHLTPMQAYILAWKHQDEPLIIDDIHDLWRYPAMRNLFTVLCDTKPKKTVQWNSTALPDDVPTSFDTTSPVLILCNDAGRLDPAIQSRAHTFRFEPTHTEKLTQAASFGKHRDILAFIKDNLANANWSLRDYTIAAQAKEAGDGHGCGHTCALHDWKLRLLRKHKLKRQEKAYLETRTAIATGKNNTKAAKAAGIGRQALWKRRKKFSI